MVMGICRILLLTIPLQKEWSLFVMILLLFGMVLSKYSTVKKANDLNHDILDTEQLMVVLFF